MRGWGRAEVDPVAGGRDRLFQFQYAHVEVSTTGRGKGGMKNAENQGEKNDWRKKEWTHRFRRQRRRDVCKGVTRRREKGRGRRAATAIISLGILLRKTY